MVEYNYRSNGVNEGGMTRMHCDLHTHSFYSDGEYSPAEIVREAKEKGLIVALTDHNRTTGLAEFTAEAEKLGVTAVSGVELTCELEGCELHLLGLFIDPGHYETVNGLTDKYVKLKIESHYTLIENLKADGISIDYEKVKKRGRDGNVNRVHFAEELMKMGLVSSVKEAFCGILKEGGGYYIPAEKLDFFEAVKFLKSINALPILAHPLKELTPEKLTEILPEAIENGLVGIEVIHSDFSAEMQKTASEIAEKFGILKSGGSDFHGIKKPGLALGTGYGNVSVPTEFYEKLLGKKQKLK